MPRSSFSDNPLLRVSRPVSACSRCRAAKVKCDGKLPACTACEKAGRENECSSANDQFARGKERSYVAALELRIEKLEKRLAFARSCKASVNLNDVDEAAAPAPADRKDSLANIRAAIHRKAARKREDADVNTLISDMAYLTVSTTTRDFDPTMSNMTFARMVLAAATNDDVPDPAEDSFPTRAEALATIQYYTANIFTLFPFFSETHLLTVLDVVFQQDERAKEGLKDTDFWLLYMVLAVGYTAQSKAHDDNFYRRGLDFVARALPFADNALTPGYPAQIQSLLLFTQYAMLDPSHFDSWYLIGFASRAVVDLGFHQDPPRLQVPDKVAFDLRRKMFYCVYALDRTISMIRTRSFSFTDDSVNVEFPSPSGPSTTLITGPQSADPALLLFQLRRIQSEWYQTLFQANSGPLPDAASFIWQMCLEMREWNESLPDNLPSGIRELLGLELRYSYVYCLAPSDRSPHLTDYARKLIFEHAIAYMNTAHGVAHGTSTAFYTSLDALKVYFVAMQFFAVFNAARELLISDAENHSSHHSPRKRTAPAFPTPSGGWRGQCRQSLRCLQQVVETLSRFSERWDIASQLKTTFETISSELFSWLQVRRQMRDQQPPQTPQQQQHPHQHQHQQHQQQQHQPQQHQQQQHQQQQHQLQHQQFSPGPPPPHPHHHQSHASYPTPQPPQPHPHHQPHPSYPPPQHQPHPHSQVIMGHPAMQIPGMMPQPGQPMVQYRWVGDGGPMMQVPPPGQGGPPR
uniref:Putative GAL4-like transcriptional activator n=1 Tax=Colletotrichum lindemuthianum TaxID=290576 RepID=Q9HG15_COLLN|nr:putative GAL4-like transcriptional activator [Colletotrichum lindemuthianum]